MKSIGSSADGKGRRFPRFIKPAIAIALVVVLAGTLAVVNRSNSKPVEKSKEAVTLEFSPADVAMVEHKELARAIPLSGSLQPLVQSTVKSKVSGEVRKVLIQEGEKVKEGQVLVEIDTADLLAKLDTQVALMEEAKAKWQIAAKNRDNGLALLKQNFISQNAFDTTQSTYEASVATVKSLEAQVRMARKALDDAVVRAPIAGTVAKKHVNAGERVAPDAALITIVDLTRMEMTALVPASEVPAVKLGQLAKFKVDGFDGRAFQGRVERINPVAEEGSRAIKLYLAVPNPDAALKGGMFAQGTLLLDQPTTGPAIPATAIREEAGQAYVYTIEVGKIAKRPVTLGLRDEASGMVHVTSGINIGTPVVAVRLDGLKPGAAAVIKAAIPVATKS